MPLPLNLFKAFEKGELIDIIIMSGDKPKPPSGRAWLILAGTVNHITATASYIDVRDTTLDHTRVLILEIPAGIATQSFPLFNVAIQTGGSQTQWTPIVVTHNDHIVVLGDAALEVHMRVLEWTP